MNARERGRENRLARRRTGMGLLDHWPRSTGAIPLRELPYNLAQLLFNPWVKHLLDCALASHHLVDAVIDCPL